MGLPVKLFRKRMDPRVAGTSRYSFFMGAITLIPNFRAWLPRSQERVLMNSNWSVRWNLGRKSGEPMRPRPEPPK